MAKTIRRKHSAEIVRKTFAATAPIRRDVGEPADGKAAATEMVFVASDSTPDSFNDRVMVAGMDLARFNANPVLLFGHNHGLPVGTGKVWVEGEGEAAKLMLTPTFSEATQLARDTKALVEDGTLKAVSVGMRLKAGGMQENERGGYDFNASELVEISFVSVPANPSAVRVKGMDEGEGLSARDFAEQMIPHHQAAIDMANAFLAGKPEDKVLVPIAEAILKAQAEEIATLQKWLDDNAPDEDEDKSEDDEDMEDMDEMKAALASLTARITALEPEKQAAAPDTDTDLQRALAAWLAQ